MQVHGLVRLQDAPPLAPLVAQQHVRGPEHLDRGAAGHRDQRRQLREALRRVLVIRGGRLADHRRLGGGVPVLDAALMVRDGLARDAHRPAARELVDRFARPADGLPIGAPGASIRPPRGRRPRSPPGRSRVGDGVGICHRCHAESTPLRKQPPHRGTERAPAVHAGRPTISAKRQPHHDRRSDPRRGRRARPRSRRAAVSPPPRRQRGPRRRGTTSSDAIASRGLRDAACFHVDPHRGSRS